MPAKSKAQQKFMGMVHGVQKGTVDPSDVSPEVRKVAGEISPSDAEDFASTKHKGLPQHVEQKLREYIRKTIREVIQEIELTEDGKWIQKAVDPSHKGYCTPMTKKTCTPRRKALAKRFKAGIENESEINESTFTRKHYVEIANILKGSSTKDAIAYALADVFEADNPLFNREKFLAAAGIV